MEQVSNSELYCLPKEIVALKRDLTAMAFADSVVGSAVVFELPVRPEPSDIDGLGHVNNIVYLRWVQDAAAAHWSAAATDDQKTEYMWVVVRHEIDYFVPAFLADDLIARTYVGAVTGARFDRHVEIWRLTGSKLVAKARSVWVALGATNGRPRRVSADLVSRFQRPRENGD